MEDISYLFVNINIWSIYDILRLFFGYGLYSSMVK